LKYISSFGWIKDLDIPRFDKHFLFITGDASHVLSNSWQYLFALIICCTRTSTTPDPLHASSNLEILSHYLISPGQLIMPGNLVVLVSLAVRKLVNYHQLKELTVGMNSV
jgi:hypothetical protein